MRKYRIKDEDERIYEVSEMTEDDDIEEVEMVNEEPVQEEEPAPVVELSPEEIGALKRLAAKVEDLLALVGEDEAPEEMEEEEVLEDGDVEVEEKEELVDTDEDLPMKKDSKASFGSIEKKNKLTSDSIDSSIEIENAWIKRYGGK